ncbi:hypothetical protein Tco_1068764 [Tanacetum coccineum]|uniref:Uncharacterized protein n=1 Tax=Tanacetum coccineum TaxID=301880 RepID=A0ABQ5HGM4_9ASTR
MGVGWNGVYLLLNQIQLKDEIIPTKLCVPIGGYELPMDLFVSGVMLHGTAGHVMGCYEFVLDNRSHFLNGLLWLREVARKTARNALGVRSCVYGFVFVAPGFLLNDYLILLGSYAFSDSLLLTPLCCDDIHDVTPRVSALAGCDKLEEISNLKSQACEKDKTFVKKNEKYDELRKARQTDQTLRMLLPKEDNVNTGKHELGFENQNDYVNPSLLNKAKELAPCLYNIDEMGKDEPSDHKIISEEELKCEVEKRLKSQLSEFADKKFDKVFQKIESMKKKKFGSRNSNDFLQQPLYDSDPSTVGSESGEKKILFGNETSSFETKIKELEMTLAQQTKDFKDAKVDSSKKTEKFESYFEKLKKGQKLSLERQLESVKRQESILS